MRADDPDLLKDLEANQVNATGQVTSYGGIMALLGWVLPLVLFGAFGYLALKSARGAAGGAGGPEAAFSFGKSKARVLQGEQTGVTFEARYGVGGAAEGFPIPNHP